MSRLLVMRRPIESCGYVDSSYEIAKEFGPCDMWETEQFVSRMNETDPAYYYEAVYEATNGEYIYV